MDATCTCQHSLSRGSEMSGVLWISGVLGGDACALEVSARRRAGRRAGPARLARARRALAPSAAPPSPAPAVQGVNAGGTDCARNIPEAFDHASTPPASLRSLPVHSGTFTRRLKLIFRGIRFETLSLLEPFSAGLGRPRTYARAIRAQAARICRRVPPGAMRATWGTAFLA